MEARADPPGGASVLVVDDTAANLQLVCGMLKERGYRARPVPSGALALQAAAADPPDLILLDVGMPGMDGFETCARLKADPRLAGIPVLFLTAHTETAEKVRAFEVGGVDYVTKPIQLEEVCARVAIHLELRRQRRALEGSYARLAELERMRDGLVHMLVHDLRAPLTVLSTVLGALRAEPGVHPALAEDLRECFEAARKMSIMVTAVLDVSKLEAAAMPLRRVPCDLAAIVQGAVGELRPLFEGRSVLVAAPAPVHLQADPGLVARVVENLLANAIQHTEEGGTIRVTIRAEGEQVRFELADDGPGVPPALQERIFEKFGQVGRPRTERRSTGLGLAFCRLAVEAHGGRIGVECDPARRGSTFWFTIPAGPG